MSRIGRLPVPVPAGVKIIRNGDMIIVEGPKGKNEESLHPNMIVEIGESEVKVSRPDDSKLNRSLHGLTRSLIHNAVVGLSQGFSKVLEIEGVGYKAILAGKNLDLELGFSHKIIIKPPENIQFSVPNPTRIEISGISKQVVGEISAKIRSLRPPEPYKGKGVRYLNEVIMRKAGKSGLSAG